MQRADYRVVLIAYISFVVLGISGSIMGVLWSPHIQEGFGQPLSALGSLLIVAPAAYFVGSLISGRLFASYPVGVMLAAGMFICTAGFAGYVLAPTWEIMVAFGILTGFGGGVLDGGMNIYFAAHFNARLMNWLHASFGMGALIAPQLVNILVLGMGQNWRVIFMLLIVLYSAIGLVYLATRQLWLPVHQATDDRTHTPFRETASLGIVWLGVFIFVGYAGAEAGAGTWAAPLFVSRGIDAVVANNQVTAYWTSFTIARIVFGLIATMFRTENIIRASLAGVIFGAALMWLHPFPGADLIGIIIFGFLLAPLFAITVTAAQERLGPTHAPNAIGFMVAAASLGAGMLPAVAGKLSEVGGLEVIPVFLVIMSVGMLVLYQLSLLPMFAVTKKKHDEPLAA
jgi:fucose permease